MPLSLPVSNLSMTILPKSLKAFYSKDDDVLADFYAPCIRNSSNYSRVSGYFSSLIFDLASDAFFDFFSRGGHMRIVCSPHLTRSDAAALVGIEDAATTASEILMRLLADKASRSSAEVLCHLVLSKMLEIKLAILDESDDLMHEKFGIFQSGQEAVSFIGSINETGRGWGEGHNKESFNVFVSWEPRDALRVSEHLMRFQSFWTDSIPGVTVRTPDQHFYSLVREHADRGKKVFTRLVKDEHRLNGISYRPLDYQAEVLDHWKNSGRRGIVRFCTGAGKTVVGLLATQWAATQKIAVLVVVPSKALLYQWEAEIRKVFPSSRVMKAGDENNGWRQRGVLEGCLKISNDGPSVVIATLATASSAEFDR